MFISAEVTCSKEQFICSGAGSKVCLARQLLCNKHTDCNNGEDEDEGLCSSQLFLLLLLLFYFDLLFYFFADIKLIIKLYSIDSKSNFK